MKWLHNISFSLLILVFIASFLGQEVVHYPVYDRISIENTTELPGTFTGGISETPNEEDISLYVHAFCTHEFTEDCHDLRLPFYILPPDVSYPVWLPPDNA